MAVSVQSAAEAKAALRELRHKRKELRHLRRGLVREAKAAYDAEMQAERRGRFLSTLSRLRGALSRRRPRRDLAEVELEIAHADEILHNLESCIIQVEGKLLHER